MEMLTRQVLTNMRHLPHDPESIHLQELEQFDSAVSVLLLLRLSKHIKWNKLRVDPTAWWTTR